MRTLQLRKLQLKTLQLKSLQLKILQLRTLQLKTLQLRTLQLRKLQLRNIPYICILTTLFDVIKKKKYSSIEEILTLYGPNSFFRSFLGHNLR